MFRDDESAEKWFASMRWPDGPVWPHCRDSSVQSGTAHPSMPYRCRGCGKRFAVRTGSVMADTKLGYRTRAVALFLLTTGIKGVSSMKLHRDLGISRKSARHLAHRIRACRERDQGLFAGPVEVDETYVGGKERNQHERKKARAGRGPVGKTPVAGARDRATNAVAARPLPGTAKGDLQGFVRARVAPGAQVRSDEAAACAGMEEFPHEAVRHSGGEYVRGAAHANGIESFRSLFKRGLYGTYHRMSVRHLGRYLTEFAGRRNDRDCDTAERMRRMARGLVGRTLTYRQLTGKAAVAARAAPSAPSAAARCRRTLHARCASRSVRGARRIRNPPARPASGPDRPCRPSSAGDPLSSALRGHASGLQGVPSTANRIPPGHARGPLLSVPRPFRWQLRFRYDPTFPCLPRPHSNDPSQTPTSLLTAVLVGHGVVGTQIYNSLPDYQRTSAEDMLCWKRSEISDRKGDSS